MIGLHAIRRLKAGYARNYLRIVKDLRANYPETKPVLVTKVTDPVNLSQMLSMTGIDWLQIHVPLSKQMAESILFELEKILGKRPSYIAVIATDDKLALPRAKELESLADYILFDKSYIGGAGELSQVHVVRQLLGEVGTTKTLVSGGLKVENITEVLSALTPDGVDVQSGLEMRRPGKPKDPARLVQFVNLVRKTPSSTQIHIPQFSYHRSFVSVALTSVPPEQLSAVLKRFRNTDIDFVHFDFSDGSMAPAFVAEPFTAVTKLAAFAPCLPYHIHLFMRDKGQQEKTLTECMRKNCLLDLVLLHLSGYEALSDKYLTDFIALITSLGIKPGLALHAPGFPREKLELTLEQLTPYPWQELSLITHSRAHSLEVARHYDLPLLLLLTAWARNHSSPPLISIDRDMTLEKMAVFASANPNHVVAGETLLSSKRPQRTIQAFRKLLCPLVSLKDN